MAYVDYSQRVMGVDTHEYRALDCLRPQPYEVARGVSWFVEQRMAWIAEMLHVYGFINRGHLMRKFGISGTQAIDLWRGAVIGTVEVVDVVTEHGSPWFFGPRGLVLRNPHSFAPAPVSGALGYFDWQSRRTDNFPEPAKWMLPEQPKESKPEPQGSLI